MKFSKSIGNNIIKDTYIFVEKTMDEIDIKYIIGATKTIEITTVW